MEKYHTFFFNSKEVTIELQDVYLLESDAKEFCKKFNSANSDLKLHYASEKFLKSQKLI